MKTYFTVQGFEMSSKPNILVVGQARLYTPTMVPSVGLMWYTSFRSLMKNGMMARQQRPNPRVNRKTPRATIHVRVPTR